MTTRVFTVRRQNINSNTAINVSMSAAEVAARVIINGIHIKNTFDGQNASFSNFYMHLFLLPTGSSFTGPYGGFSKIPVASFTYGQTTSSTTGVNFNLPPTLTFRSGSQSMAADNIDSKYMMTSYSDFLSGISDGVIIERSLITGAGYLSNGASYMRWNIPEHFYMSPGDSLQLCFGGYTGSAIAADPDTLTFVGADLDLICIADSN